MIAETGHFALILALLVAVIQAVLPMIGAIRRDSALMALAGRAALLQFALTATAFGALVWCYAVSDFSVLNVAANSHDDKPLLYKISGVWSNHEGSLLLFILVLTLYGAGLAMTGRTLPPTLKARALAVQAMLGAGFILFALLTSNPFVRLDPPAQSGLGMNPILQDPGLAVHPPLLYLGYVGFSMAFSLSIAGLIEGRIDAAWARLVRLWTLIAWSALTAGIALGSWWAYVTLGWGGFWYWDPVENASLLPWLTGTALLHVLTVVERRGALQSWAVLLAILTFSLALLGTFLVRSGILTSVHSFAADPARGVFILALLGLVAGGALFLFSCRAPLLASNNPFEPVSREGGLLLASVLLSSAAGTVLLGTLYPVLTDALGLGKISVGPSFFNATALPLMAPLAAMAAIGPLLAWKRGRLGAALTPLVPAFVLALCVTAAALLLPGSGDAPHAAALGLGLAAWGAAGALTGWVRTVRNRPGQKPSWRIHGVTLAHLGLALTIAGIAGQAGWSQERIERLRIGDHVTLGGYEITLQAMTSDLPGPNYLALRATLAATRDGQSITILSPEKRRFYAPRRTVSVPAIRTGFFGDLYAALGDGDDKGGWVVRLYRHILTPWIFAGAGLMVLGGLLSMMAGTGRTPFRKTRRIG